MEDKQFFTVLEKYYENKCNKKDIRTRACTLFNNMLNYNHNRYH